MNCHRCGNTLPTNAKVCPDCDSAHSRTKVLSQADLHKTRALIPLERCENCGWMVYPAETECSACGTWVNRPWKQTGSENASRRAKKEAAPRAEKSAERTSPFDKGRRVPRGDESKRVWGIVAISLAVLCLSVLAWHYLFATNLQ